MKKEPCDLGKYIRSGLKAKDMNQTTLAEKCLVTKAHISHIITGRTNPSLWTLIKITRILELDLNEAMRAFFGAEAWDAVMENTKENLRYLKFSFFASKSTYYFALRFYSFLERGDST